MIEEKKIESINGYYRVNSALGNYLRLQVKYQSGETLYASAEGGNVMPDVPLESFIIFFKYFLTMWQNKAV